MKKLKKLLLINWLYFSKQLIEVGDINFLTGKNGAGKSTVIDALQIVLLGETSARNFNQAANEKSQRTLDGYLRADLDGRTPGSRRGCDFSSYIACEFQDEAEGTSFVTGIIFDCYSDGARQERYFIYDGVIPESCFLEGKKPMDISELRSYLRQRYAARQKMYDGHKQYRIDMLAKWNVHNEQVTRMLKKAVSFRPIVDIQKFITENICDIPDKPNIEDMQQNIRDYKKHEQMAQRQEEKLSALQEISRLYREMQSAFDRWEQQHFLVLWAQKEDLAGQVQQRRLEQEDCRVEAEKAGAEFERLSGLIVQKEQRKTELIAACAQSSVAQEEEKLRTNKDRLLQEQKDLLKQLRDSSVKIKREALLLSRFCEAISDWPADEILMPVIRAAGAVHTAYTGFLNADEQVFSQPAAIFEKVQEVTAGFMDAVRTSAYQVDTLLSRLKREQDQRRAALANLQKNIKTYSKELLQLRSRIAVALERQAGHPVEINILADVLEIAEAEEAWRNAVEGYLNTQKFHLLIDPPYYEDALAVYDRIKKDFNSSSFGLVDIAKLREKERIIPRPDSLAQKIETENNLARSYIDYLLGRVVCCSNAGQLRHHRTAITADGMVYQNYVARPLRRSWMENAFIGRRAVALQIAQLEADMRSAGAEIARWEPVSAQLEAHKSRDVLFSQFFVQGEAAQRCAGYVRGLEAAKELEQIDDTLSHLDLFWLDQQRQQIRELDVEIAALGKDRLLANRENALREERVRKLEQEELPELYRRLTAAEDRLAEEFPSEFVEKTGIPRYQQEFQRLKRAAVIAKNFENRLAQTQKERDTAQQKLFQARADYVRTFQPCSFSVESMVNDEFEQEQHLLEQSELPKYREKIVAARESALEQFQNDFLAKLKSSIDQVQDQVKSLNRALRRLHSDTEQYQFRADRNPDYAEYYDMIMAPELMEGEGGLFTLPFQQKYGKLIEELFSRLAMSDDTQLNARKQTELQQSIELYTDFRTYLRFDLETTDRSGSKQLLSQTLNTKSGGETQTPFYIAVLASFAQLYQVNNLSSLNNTVRLVVFDEAFNKMDGERIIESVRLLREFGLQAIICTPPDKLPDIMPLADRTFLVNKDLVKGRYCMHVLHWSKENNAWNKAES